MTRKVATAAQTIITPTGSRVSSNAVTTALVAATVVMAVVASGLMTAAVFVPFDQTWLVWVSLVPMLAVMWSSVSHWVLGVPFDMISRARRYGGQAQADLEALVRITTGRLLHITRTAGSMLIAVAAFMVTMLLVLGFYYDVEFAQAVLFLLVPMILVTSLSLRAALRIETGQFEGQALDRLLARPVDIRHLTMLSDILPTGFHGAIKAGVGVGSTVYVAGAGPVGLAVASLCPS